MNRTDDSLRHDDARRLLSARLDAPLTNAEADTLAAHLADCRNCRAFEQRLAAGMLGLTTLPRVPGNPAVAAAVRTNLAATDQAGWLRNGLKLAGALVAFALVGVVLVVVLRPHGGAAPQQPAAAVGSPTATIEHTVVPRTPSTATEAPGTPTAAATGPGPCISPQVALHTAVEGAAGTLYIGVTATSPWVDCQSNTIVTLTLADAAGKPLSVEGNGATASIALAPFRGSGSAVFAWTNLCDVAGPFQVVAKATHTTSVATQFNGPPCNAPGQPARLSYLSDVTPQQPNPVIPGGALPACDPAHVGRSLTFYNATTDGPLVELDVWPLDNLCRLIAEAAFDISGPNGEHLGFVADRANPVVTVALTAPTPAPVLRALWTQPCPADGTWRIEASLGGMTAIVTEDNPPCDAAATDASLAAIPTTASPPAATPTNSNLPDCQPGQLNVTPRPELTGADVTFTITASLFPLPTPATVGTPCRLAVVATLSLTGPDGKLLAIDGNGTPASVDNELGQHDAQIAFVWSNWCSSADVYYADSTLGEQHSGFKFQETPVCADTSQPSTLTAVAVPSPTSTPTPTLAPCGPDAFTLESDAQGYSGTIGFGAGIVLTGAPCHLVSDATVAILDAAGNPLPVDGNPTTVHIDANLTTAGLGVDGGWRNWCGGQGDIQFVVTVGQQRVSSPATATARCDVPGQSSTLTHVAVYDPNAERVRPLVPTATP